MLTIDHGFNASTFTARVVASTGADLADVVGAALGALAGPLHGGAPGSGPRRPRRHRRPGPHRGLGGGRAGRRAADHGLRPPRVPRPRPAIGAAAGDRHRPRCRVRRLVDQAVEVEQRVLATLARVKPDRPLPSNVEFFAGVVMASSGLPALAVHADVRRQPHGRLDRPRRRAGRPGQADPPQRPLRRPAALVGRPASATCPPGQALRRDGSVVADARRLQQQALAIGAHGQEVRRPAGLRPRRVAGRVLVDERAPLLAPTATAACRGSTPR